MKWNEPAPGEREAEERSWRIVRAAWAERPALSRRRTVRRAPLVAIAVALALAAAFLSPPGLAVLGTIRDAVRGEKNARPALFSLPSSGRLLVESARGVWVVQRDGSKRLLTGYRDGAWSPHGLYLAAVHGHELRALEPNGKVHWSLARPGRIASPRWSFEGYRLAYLDSAALRVVNGDGTGDHVLAATVADVAPAWRPATHAVAFVGAGGEVKVVDVDTHAVLQAFRPAARPKQLEWSADGRLLLTRGAHSIVAFGPGRQRIEAIGPGAAPIADAAFSPDGRSIAFVQRAGERSVLWLDDRLRPDGTKARLVFAGAGVFADVNWSPDGRWLLLTWTSADQLLFIRSAAVRKVVAVSNVASNFGPGAKVAGWCCATGTP